MSSIAIRVEHLTKEYHIGALQQRNTTLQDAASELLSAPMRGMVKLFSRQAREAADGGSQNILKALDDVSFEIKTGTVMGIIGRNGAGKSTLLKVLSRITEPTSGQATIRGRVGALLEVGTGFHPELTGRENIYLNGAILGMGRSEIDRKFDEIVAFAEVSRFIDTPVKRYSSGMYLRLAFAVAAHLEPSVLLVDEVLAVGDAGFQKKCLGKMQDIAGEGRTLIFVSHNLASIKALTDSCILLKDGRVEKIGHPEEVINTYLAGGPMEAYSGKFPEEHLTENRVHLAKYQRSVELKSVTLFDASNNATSFFKERSDVTVELEFAVKTAIPALEIRLPVKTLEGQLTFTCLPTKYEMALDPGIYRAQVTFNLGPLLANVYQGDVMLLSNLPQDKVNSAFQVEIIADPQPDTPGRLVQYSSNAGMESTQATYGLIYVPSQMRIVELESMHLPREEVL